MENNSFPTLDKKQATNVWYTMRRHFVDSFHQHYVPELPVNSLVLDLGGEVLNKRGLFDINEFKLNVLTLNYSSRKKPNIQGDACNLPFRDEQFNAVLCSELLEHVYNPHQVLLEAHRILKVNGRILICVPFLCKIHGDPDDFGRYSRSFWERTLQQIGYKEVHIEEQGLYWCVLMDCLRDLIYPKLMKFQSQFLVKAASYFFGLGKIIALNWDNKYNTHRGSGPQGYTTGYGILAKK
jgi:SAM-dependent methyltransferase